MNYALIKEVERSFLHWINNRLIDASKKFMEEFGFTKEEILGKSIRELGNMLRTDFNALIETPQENYNCYMFTKAYEVKEVSISSIVLEGKNENIFYLNGRVKSPFEEVMPFIHNFFTNNKIGVAIHSIPDLMLLKTNEKYLSFQDFPYNSMGVSIGKQGKDRFNMYDGSSAEDVFKEVIRTGEGYFVEEFEYEGFNRGITYWDSNITPIIMDGKAKFIVQTILEVTDRVLNRRIIKEQKEEIREQKEFIKKQKDQLEAIIKGLGDEIVMVDKAGSFLELKDLLNNESCGLMKNYQQAYKKMGFYDLEGNMLPYDETCTAKALKGEKVKNLKVKTIRDGKIKYSDNTGIPIFNKNNELEFVIRITHDITELVEQGKKITDQKRQLEAIIENISDGISIVDSKGKYKLLNKNSRESLLPPKEYLGDVHDWYKESGLFYLNGDKVPFQDTPENRIARGEKFSNLNLIAKFPNKSVHFDVSGTPIYDDGGRLLQGVICTRDMTDYYKQEEILKEKNEFLNRLIDNLQLPFFAISSPDLRILKLNQKAFDIIKIFNPDVKSIVHFKEKIITDVFESLTGTEYYKKIKEVIEEKKTKHINNNYFVINGNDTYCNIIFEPVFELNGEIKEILVVIIDISAEMNSNKIMEKALKSQEEFLANISHELKTPLNVIYSTIQLFNLYLKSGTLEQKKDSAAKYINSMMQNCYRLSKLINNIVDLSKIEAGFFDLNLSNNNIVEIVEDIVLSVTNYTDIKGLSIIFDTDTEEKIIACDTEKIERVILNLISNAIKFSDAGNEIVVSFKDKNEFVEISVKDSGIGIEAIKLDMIFDRFNQVDKSLSRNAEGTGIGLSLVKAIVELHQGRIYVESEFGKGSKFTVVLPTRKVMMANIPRSGTLVNIDDCLRVELSDIN